jgi:hypothetical protein
MCVAAFYTACLGGRGARYRAEFTRSLGVSQGVVHRWRKFLDVTRTNNPGTHRLVQASAQAGGDAAKVKEWTDAERQAKRELAERLDLGRHLQPGYHGPTWTAEQKAQLGTLPDDHVARQIGRTPEAARLKREELGIPNPMDVHRWTAEEIAQLGTASDAKVAARIGRSQVAVSQKRINLGIPPARPSWTADEIARLGTATDAKVAKRIGRTPMAVTLKWCALGIPTARDGLRRENR